MVSSFSRYPWLKRILNILFCEIYGMRFYSEYFKYLKILYFDYWNIRNILFIKIFGLRKKKLKYLDFLVLWHDIVQHCIETHFQVIEISKQVQANIFQQTNKYMSLYRSSLRGSYATSSAEKTIMRGIVYTSRFNQVVEEYVSHCIYSWWYIKTTKRYLTKKKPIKDRLAKLPLF
jgi:hypothetical protein